MIVTAENLLQIIRNGGHVRIRSSVYTPENLIHFASNAKDKARLEIVVTSMLTQQQMVQLAALGGGNVLLDLAGE